MKFGWSHYWKPTPKGIRKLADSLLAAALTVSTISFANDYKTIAIVVLIVAGVAKFLSNFFSEEDKSKETL